MSIINKMHQDFEQLQNVQPILSNMPVQQHNKKPIVLLLISLLLCSSLGLTYLIFMQEQVTELTETIPSAQPLAAKVTKAKGQQEKHNKENLASENVALAKPDRAAAKPATIEVIAEPVAAKVINENLASEKVALAKPDRAAEKPATIEIIAEPVAAKVINENLASEKVALAKPDRPATKKAAAQVTKAKVQPGAAQVIKAKGQPKKHNKENLAIENVALALPNFSSSNTPAVVSKADKSLSHLEIKTAQLSKAQRAKLHLDKADSAQAKGDLISAARKREQALSLQPSLNEVRKSLALYYYGQGDAANALRLLQKGALVSPDYTDFSLMLSRIALQAGNLQKAYLYLKQHPPKVEGNVDYYVSYAILAHKFKQYEQAELLYGSLLSQDPNNGRWRMSLAIAQDKQAKTALAVSSYKKALLQSDLSDKAKVYINQRLKYLHQKDGML